MLKLIKDFLKEEDGMETIEVVVIIAVLVAVALVFKDGIMNFLNLLMDKLFDPDSIKDKIG